MPVLSVKNLTKLYADDTAVKGISFDVREGEIVGLLGPNGAGKTTTISMIMGVLLPSGGSMHIGEYNVLHDRSRALSHTNFAAVYAQMPGNLTVRQNLKVFARLYGVTSSERIERVMDELEIQRFADTKCGLLSSGEQMRVSVAKALLNSPRLLLLDEPTASLDPSSAKLMREKMKEYAAQGAGILWTSHNMHEVVEVCDRVLFLSHGAILLEGDPRTLPETHGKKDLEELFIAVAREPLSLSE